jgi:hypothetical protein
MAADAIALRMAHQLLVTARARPRRIVVRRVTRRARRVLGCGKHRLISMAGRARLDLDLAEAMRRVAAGAARMAGRQSAVVDMTLRRLFHVAPHAALVGGQLGLVHSMAVEAAAQSGVLRLFGGVTGHARLGIERWDLMRVVTIAARLGRVRTDGVNAALRSVVTTHARRFMGGTGDATERVAVLADGRMDARMQRRHGLGVTARAHLGRRRREPRLAVTRFARDLANVRDVARACGDVVIARRNLLGPAIGGRSASNDEDRKHENMLHGRDPIGWHKRHGNALSETRLDHPGGCGLPPTPPTL